MRNAHSGGSRRFFSADVLTNQAVSGRKRVMFGSPAVAEFDLMMPATSMRKLSAVEAKRMFSMEPAPGPGDNSGVHGDESNEMNELTKQNASVLAQIEAEVFTLLGKMDAAFR